MPFGTTPVQCASNRCSQCSQIAQDAIDTVIDSVGRDKAQRLWSPLLAAQAEQPVKLQWLPLLACWLTSPSPPSYADLEAAPAGAHSSVPPSPGQSPQHAQNGAQAAAEGSAVKGRPESRQHPKQAAPEISLDQHAEQAFQLQEAAMRVGYAAAALPLWEHFLWRFFSHQVLLHCTSSTPAVQTVQHFEG